MSDHHPLATVEFEFKFGSREFWSAVELRERLLREPLGLTLTVAELLQEGPPMVHYGIFEWLDEETPSPAIACAIAVPLGAGIWKLRQIAVAAKYQGKGLGARVVLGLESHLAFQGACGFRLHSRENGRGFYEKLGYHATSEPFTEIGIPHVLMEKHLLGSVPAF
jgi:ribosomal protein S18 acetylase RimI-like enzyme